VSARRSQSSADHAVPRKDWEGARLDAAAVDDGRVEYLHIAAAVRPGAEVCRRVAADHLDLRHHRGAALQPPALI
jgi:hypothetical protein